MEQQATNVWRKRAFSAMKSAQDQFGKDVQGSDRLLGCLDTFRERVDHNVENTVPPGLVRESWLQNAEGPIMFWLERLFVRKACPVESNAIIDYVVGAHFAKVDGSLVTFGSHMLVPGTVMFFDRCTHVRGC